MTRQQITFFVTGLIAGLVCVVPLVPELMGLLLFYGVGSLFFVAVFASIIISGARAHLKAGFSRYLAGFVLCTVTYVVALMVLFAVGGFLSELFDGRAGPGFDVVWLSLVPAAFVGATGIALFTILLTRDWSNALLRRLLLAGFLTLGLTFLFSLPFHSRWSFLGILIPVGCALFSWAVGTEIWRHPEAPNQRATA